MPKGRVITFIPTTRITDDLRADIGLQESVLGGHITSHRALIQALRHSVEHFDIKVVSDSDARLIDWIEFNDAEQGNHLVARFRAQELLPFLQYYTNCLLENMRLYREENP